MKNLILVLFVFASQVISAQNHVDGDRGYHQFEEDDICYLIADNVNIRSEASTKASVVTNVPIGTEVTILEESSKQLRLKGFKANWYKVKFKGKEKKMTGYVWGGLIAEGSVTCASDNDIRFMYGIESSKEEKFEYYSNYKIKIQMRACKNNKELSKIVLEGDGNLEIYHWIENFGNKGLEGIKDIIEFGVSQQMCAGVNAYNYVFWNGEKMIYATQLRPGGDAPYFASDDLIFPTDEGGVKGKIIRDEKSGESLDDGTDNIESHSRVEYEWTGEKLKKTKVLIDEKRKD
jgi:hypothetical protein